MTSSLKDNLKTKSYMVSVENLLFILITNLKSKSAGGIMECLMGMEDVCLGMEVSRWVSMTKVLFCLMHQLNSREPTQTICLLLRKLTGRISAPIVNEHILGNEIL
jgi:hypothetical protein